jgi:hypothetical protein
MKKNLFALLFIITTPFLVLGQSSLLDELLAVSSVSAGQFQSKLNRHITSLQDKKSENDVAFLHKIFQKTQHRFLKSYTPYESFDKLFISGKYDCLTATALYSILLEQFHFDFRVIETNYHIFIIARTSGGDVLLETTDRYHGFVKDRKEIEKRIGTYKQNLIASKNPDVRYYDYSFQLYKEVNPIQLAGLLHFNQAVNAFNSKQWKLCADQLELSAKKYNSPRVKELAVLLVETVLQSSTDEELKQSVLQRFKSAWLESQPMVARN